jgi:hypothetical protein
MTVDTRIIIRIISSARVKELRDYLRTLVIFL